MKTILYSAVLLLGITACKETELITQNSLTQLPTLLELKEKVYTKTDVDIIIQSQSSIHTREEDLTALVSINKNKDSKAARSGISTSYTIGGLALSQQNARPETSANYMQLYGHEIPIVQQLKTANAKTSSDTTYMYVPMVMRLRESPEIVKVGTKISWNEDAKNTQGVIVEISDMVSGKTNGFILEDNGSFVLTEVHLNKFVDDANLTFVLVRGNINVSQENKTESHKTGIITSATMSATFKK